MISKELVNEIVTVSSNLPNSKIAKFVPIQVQIIKYEKEWYPGQLNSNIIIDNSEFDLLKFQPKNKKFFKLNKYHQLCVMRLASSIHKHEISESGYIK